MITVSPSTFQESSIVNLTVDADEPCSGCAVRFLASDRETRAGKTVDLGEAVFSGGVASLSVRMSSAITNLAKTAPSKADRIASTGASVSGMDLDKIKSIYIIAYVPEWNDSVVAEVSFYPATVQFWPSNSVTTSSMREGASVAVGQSLVFGGGASAPSGNGYNHLKTVLIVAVVAILGIVALAKMANK